MKRAVRRIRKRMMVQTAVAVCLAVCLGGTLQAEEATGYYDEAGNWISGTAEENVYTENAGAVETGIVDTVSDPVSADGGEQLTAASESMTGTYSVEAGWSVDTAAGTEDRTVYKQDACVGMDGTSTISCGYMDTNYSVLEYEQLRDMLTNNLLYNNVNAQISTSASYTQNKDYLYIVIVDDSAQDYKDVYHYVVGDYRCFCVEVREYRAEADQAVAEGRKTPHEVGQTVAEAFTWDET